jgi:hypothetical protein
MTRITKFKVFLLFDLKTKQILVEAFVFLGWARLLKSFRFSKIAPSFGEYMKETPLKIVEGNLKLLKNVSQAVNLMSRHTPWDSVCLVKAIAAMKMLERRQIESTIYFGTAKDDQGKLIAHAWLRSGPYIITGADEMNRFVVVSKYAKKISHS